MRIGMRLLLGYFLIVAIAAWFVLSIFVEGSEAGRAPGDRGDPQ